MTFSLLSMLIYPHRVQQHANEVYKWTSNIVGLYWLKGCLFRVGIIIELNKNVLDWIYSHPHMRCIWNLMSNLEPKLVTFCGVSVWCMKSQNRHLWNCEHAVMVKSPKEQTYITGKSHIKNKAKMMTEFGGILIQIIIFSLNTHLY